MDKACNDAYSSSDEEDSKKNTSYGLFMNHDGLNGMASSSESSIGSDDESGIITYNGSKPLNQDEIKNHLKGDLSFGLPIENDRSDLKYIRKSPTSGIIFHQPKTDYISKEIEAASMLNDQKDDIKQGYRLVRELMAAGLHNINSLFISASKNIGRIVDISDVIKNPMWLTKIKDNIINGEYNSITEIVRDLRIMMENAYILYGPSHYTTKKAMHLEYYMEKKLDLMPDDMKEICTLEKSNGIIKSVDLVAHTKSTRICVRGEVYCSQLLYNVRGAKLAREKEFKQRRIDAFRKAKLEKEMELFKWEEKLSERYRSQINSMWELPQIGQFLAISLTALNIFEISQFEVERMLLLPESSINLRILMTSLVSSPLQRSKIAEKPYMPHSIWAKKLAAKVLQWYKLYKKEKGNATKLSEQLGIDPQFWEVCGAEWPFKDALFHELEFYKRVWLLKSLCDYVAHNHKSVQEAIMEQADENLREKILGKDRDENEFIYFPQFINYNIRIYKRAPFVHVEEELTPNFERKSPNKVFNKDQIKYYKAVLRNSKRKIQNEDVWEYRTMKKTKRTSRPVQPSPVASPATPRSRPGNLRQRPTQRVLNEPIQNFIESSDEEIEQVPVRSIIPETISCTKQSNKITPTKRGRRKNFSCTICNKTFSVVGALNGHMSVHSKKKKTPTEVSSDSEVKEETNNETQLNQNEQNIHESVIDIKKSGLSAPELSKSLMDLKPVKKEEINDCLKSEDNDKKDIVQDRGCISNISSLNIEEKKPDVESHLVKEDKKYDLPQTKTEVSVFKNSHIKGEENSTNEIEFIHDELGFVKEIAANHDELSSVDGSEAKPDELDSLEKEQDKSSELCLNDNIEVNKESTSIEEGNVTQPSESVETESNAPGINLSENNFGDVMDVDEKSDSIPDIVWKFCDPDKFQLVVCTVEDLRLLIRKFGPVPSKPIKEVKQNVEEKSDEDYNTDEFTKEENEENDYKQNEQSNYEDNLPACEKSLYDNLCALLTDYLPYESKLKVLHRQTLKKMTNEESSAISLKKSNSVDPDEEAWKSEPEPEPEPTPEPPKVSSSSSTSEEEFYDDGARKRKLRKRKGRPAKSVSQSASCEPTPVPSPTCDYDEETTTISSRGRVRKIKKTVNYDKFDFDKLAEEANNEASLEKERKKRRKNGFEEENTMAEDMFKVSSSGVQRYLISKAGDVEGYIDTDGNTHYSNKPKTVKIPKPPPIIKPSPKVPTVAVLAKTVGDNEESEIMVKLTGTQACNILLMAEKVGKSNNRNISVTHNGKMYTFPLNSKYYPSNVPGYEDCEIPIPISKRVPPKTENSEKIHTTFSYKDQLSNKRSDVHPLQQKAEVTDCSPVAMVSAPLPFGQMHSTSKRVIFKTAKGPVQLNVSNSLASLLKQTNTSKIIVTTQNSVIQSSASLSTTSIYSSPGPSSSTGEAPTKMLNTIKIYKPPLPSNVLSTPQSTSNSPRYLVINQSPCQTPVQAVQTQPNNFIQINNAPNSQMIQIQQPNIIQYSQPTTATIAQPTYVPVANVPISQPTTYIQPAPIYNQVIVQQPQIQIPTQPVIIPQPVQQMVPTSPISKGNSKVFILQTNEGQKVCLQTAEGKLVLLTNEQIQLLVKRGTLKSNPT